MGVLLLGAEGGLLPRGLGPLQIVVDSGVEIGVFHLEGVVLRHGLLPADGALRGVLRSGSAGFRKDPVQGDLPLLVAGGGDGQVGPDKHAGGKGLLLQLESGPDADAAGQLSLFLHEPDAPVQPVLGVRALGGALRAGQRHPGPLGKGGLRLAQGLEKPTEEVGLTIDVDPADLAPVHPAVKFLLGKVGEYWFADAPAPGPWCRDSPPAGGGSSPPGR